MNHQGTKTIETDRLILRRFTMDDCEPAFRNWVNDPEVCKYLIWKPHGTIEVTKEVMGSWVDGYEKPDQYIWAIVPKALGQPIGSISAVHILENINAVHIGYCIGKKWWHQGITSEALAALIRFFFDEVEVNRIELRHDSNNPRSGMVMKKCGLKYEGTLRQADVNNQGIVDACYYSILRSEYLENKKQ